jgi:H+/Cl- antiporter ClcA
MNLWYLIIGVACGAAGFLMLFMALCSSPFQKKREKHVHRENNHPDVIPPYDRSMYRP